MADYLKMSVDSIWSIDPKTRSGRMCSASGWMPGTRLRIAGMEIHMELDALARLDRYPRVSR